MKCTSRNDANVYISIITTKSYTPIGTSNYKHYEAALPAVRDLLIDQCNPREKKIEFALFNSYVLHTRKRQTNDNL